MSDLNPLSFGALLSLVRKFFCLISGKRQLLPPDLVVELTYFEHDFEIMLLDPTINLPENELLELLMGNHSQLVYLSLKQYLLEQIEDDDGVDKVKMTLSVVETQYLDPSNLNRLEVLELIN